MTDLERQRLADIECHLQWSDPGLAQTLYNGRFRDQRRHRIGTAVVTASMVAFAVGVLTQSVIVLVAGWVLWTTGIMLRRFAA